MLHRPWRRVGVAVVAGVPAQRRGDRGAAVGAAHTLQLDPVERGGGGAEAAQGHASPAAVHPGRSRHYRGCRENER